MVSDDIASVTEAQVLPFLTQVIFVPTCSLPCMLVKTLITSSFFKLKLVWFVMVQPVWDVTNLNNLFADLQFSDKHMKLKARCARIHCSFGIVATAMVRKCFFGEGVTLTNTFLVVSYTCLVL